jgi:hypothetical protein
VTDRFRREYELAADDLQRLMNTIVDQAEEDEARDVERLLGALTTVSAGARGTISFVAPRDTSPLLDRALRVMARSDRHHARAIRARNRT